ncbi:hypothetical protein CUN85_10600 [Methanolobus halotolerans]|uniref:Uncharacterized protein n=2 Tax=Methanolobus halotolerans TaxID=2052935 RepID=A0A4E0PVA9_9EURY|nr:hypothetical protein CUN85_10600 [Methanolobus halotolerans]
MNMLYNLREWICDCDRFLFLAEVHYHNEAVVPSKHKFDHVLSGEILEDLLSRTSIECDSDSYHISFDHCISPDEFSLLKQTLDDIRFENWTKIKVENVILSQEILRKLAKALDEDIMKTYELKGFPSLYSVCGIRYV